MTDTEAKQEIPQEVKDALTDGEPWEFHALQDADVLTPLDMMRIEALLEAIGPMFVSRALRLIAAGKYAEADTVLTSLPAMTDLAAKVKNLNAKTSTMIRLPF